jgi:hypothetical protein
MPNRQLSKDELKVAKDLFADLIEKIRNISKDDSELYFAYCRRFTTKFIHEERGTPGQRNKIKKIKHLEQNGLCTFCGEALPEKEAELDRINAADGYSVLNTRLVHQICHRQDQALKGYK